MIAPHKQLQAAIHALLKGRWQTAKEVLFQRARALGLFDAALKLTRGRLRILCYHAFSRLEEHTLDPYLFMRESVFEGRLAVLRRRKATILDLDAAVVGLAQRRLPLLPCVLTFDDGFVSTLDVWRRRLAGRYPATLYVTTEASGGPVFNVAFRYLVQQSGVSVVDLSGLDLGGPVPDRLSADALRPFLSNKPPCLRSPAGSRRALEQVAAHLGVDWTPIDQHRCFDIASAKELKQAADDGFDLQLHTHSHRLPEDPADVRREIDTNRACLAPLAARTLKHFCYPSGRWSPAHFAPLHAASVASATTCEPGLNTAATPPLALSRFVDGDHLSDLIFEAEITGFAELLRQARRRLTQRGGPRRGG